VFGSFYTKIRTSFGLTAGAVLPVHWHHAKLKIMTGVTPLMLQIPSLVELLLKKISTQTLGH
jgi:hypothetical protein